MLENTTVTLSLEDFDVLRDAEKFYKKLRSQIAKCFEYSREEKEDPIKCKTCRSDVDCDDCDIYKNHNEYDEKVTVYVGQLVDAVVCHGASEAIDTIENYLRGGDVQ